MACRQGSTQGDVNFNITTKSRAVYLTIFFYTADSCRLAVHGSDLQPHFLHLFHLLQLLSASAFWICCSQSQLSNQIASCPSN